MSEPLVADGLRGDRLFEMEEAKDAPGAAKHMEGFARTPRAPFLHAVARSTGRWGISHARPPTESRPGQGLTLVHFSAQPEPFLTQCTP